MSVSHSYPVFRLFSARLSVFSLPTLLAASLLAKLLPLDVEVPSLMLRDALEVADQQLYVCYPSKLVRAREGQSSAMGYA